MTVGQPSLRHNFSWVLLGNVTYAACLWGVLAALTKLGDPETVGRFSLASAVATPLIMFSNLQLRPIYATDAADSHSFGDYQGLRIVLLPAALLVVAIIAVAGYNRPQALAIVLFGVVRVFENFSDLFYGVAQKYERMDVMAHSLILRGLATLSLTVVFYWLSGDLGWGLAGMALGMALPLLIHDLPRCRSVLVAATGAGLRVRFDKSTMRRIVWLALPMGLVVLCLQLRQTIPRTFLESNFGENELGIFSALFYLVIAGSTITMALAQSSIARLSRYYAAGERRPFVGTVGRLLVMAVALGIGGVLVALVAGRPLLTLLYTAEYAQHGDLFVLIMGVGGFMYLNSLLGAPATAMRLFREQLVVQTANVVLMLALAWWLIPRYGMTGAALTALGGAVFLSLGYLALLRLGIARMPSPGAGT